MSFGATSQILGLAQDTSSSLRAAEVLRGQELRLAYEIMLSVSLVTQSVGLYLHPAKSVELGV